MLQAIDHTETEYGKVSEGRLVLGHLEEPDPVVVRVVSEADDVLEASRACLQVGARALLAGHAALDEVLVGRSFDQLVGRLDASVDKGVGRIAQTATDLLGDDNGALTRMLAEVRQELEQRLGQLFDPQSKTSALSLLEEVFTGASMRSAQAWQASLNLEDEQSPLGRWRAELTHVVREQTDSILREVKDLATSIAIKEGRADLWERTSLKGLAYEDVVHLAFAEIAAHHGDIIESVGRERGTTGALVGDIAIGINPEECGGHPRSLVLEAKNRRLGLRKTLEELSAAMANREAQAGIAVFASRELAPTPSVFVPYGDKAILVLDADAPDPAAAELAYVWARWTLRKSQTSEADSLDTEQISEGIAAAVRALDRSSTIRRCHSTVRKQIDQAAVELNDLVTEVQTAIDQVRCAVSP